jgi:hypothetical protein
MRLIPSIPEIEAVALMKHWLFESDISNKDAELYSELIDLVVSQKVFKFNNKFYEQESGASIESLLSPWEAEVFMNDLEERLMEKPGKPRFYRRYVDDVIAIIEKGKAEETLELLNSMHSNIEFTVEREQEGKLAFLDILIIRNGKNLDFEIYRKPTDAQLCIPFHSHTPISYKLAAFESLFHRLYDIPLSEIGFKKEVDYIYEMARKNGFPDNIIKGVHRKHEKRRDLRNLTTLSREIRERNPETGEKRMLALNFYPPLTDKIIKVSKKHGISSSYTSRGSLEEHLVNLKDKRRMEEKSGIYEITCATCKRKYRGQSKRRAHRRYNEHERACRLKYPVKSAVANHCVSNRHEIGELKLLKEVTN